MKESKVRLLQAFEDLKEVTAQQLHESNLELEKPGSQYI